MSVPCNNLKQWRRLTIYGNLFPISILGTGIVIRISTIIEVVVTKFATNLAWRSFTALENSSRSESCRLYCSEVIVLMFCLSLPFILSVASLSRRALLVGIGPGTGSSCSFPESSCASGSHAGGSSSCC